MSIPRAIISSICGGVPAPSHSAACRPAETARPIPRPASFPAPARQRSRRRRHSHRNRSRRVPLRCVPAGPGSSILDDSKDKRPFLPRLRVPPGLAALRPAPGEFPAAFRLLVRAGYGGHSSNAITMSEPRSRWISIDVSGPMKVGVQSRWFWKCAPSSVIFRSFASEKTWKPSAVREDRVIPAHELVQPTLPRDELLPGAHVQVVCVSQDDLRAELPELQRAHRLHRPLRAHRHEDRGANRPRRVRSTPRRAFDDGSVLIRSNVLTPGSSRRFRPRQSSAPRAP